MTSFVKITSLIPSSHWRKLVGFALFQSLIDYLGIAIVLPVVHVARDASYLVDHPDIATLVARIGLSTHRQFVLAMCAVCLCVFALKFGLSYYLTARTADTLHMISHRVISRLMRKMLACDYSLFFSEKLSTMVGSLCAYGHNVSMCIGSISILLAESLLGVLIGAMILWLNPLAALVVGGVCLGIGTFLRFHTYARISRSAATHREQQGAFYALGYGITNAHRDIKVMGIEGKLANDFETISDAQRQTGADLHTAQIVPRLLGEFVLALVVVLGVIYVIVSGVQLEQHLPMIAVAVVASIRILPAMQKVASAYGQLRYQMASVTYLADLEEQFDAHVQPCEQVDLPFAEQLDFQDIVYTYPGKVEPALKQVSVAIPRLGFVGLIGGSGSGKSTFLDVLSGLLKADSGTVTMDGQAIDPYDSNAIRRYLGYVPQTVALFDSTIGFNISFDANYRDNLDQVRTAAERARIAEYIESLPEGYHTPVGERGIKLSGGQRQRLGIARALYSNPQILLLDEATSNLDNHTEREFMHVLEELRSHCTVVFATHRLSSVVTCDCIYLFDKGTVVGSGNHAELMQDCPAYTRLLNGDVSVD